MTQNFNVAGTSYFNSTVFLNGNVNDNRSNGFIVQSANTVASNRELVLGNGLYAKIRMHTKGLYVGAAFPTDQYLFYVDGGVGSGALDRQGIYLKPTQPGVGGNVAGGDIIMELPNGTGTGRKGAVLVGSSTATGSSAIVDIQSTDRGILIPRMTLAQRDAITSPATGLQIYNTDSNVFQYYNGTSWGNVGGTGVTDLTFSGSSSPFTLNSSTGTDVNFASGTGINLSLSGNQLTITNSAPDQTVSLTGAGISSVTGTYPNFTITSTEVDGSTTNEIQNLSLSGQSLGISSGTGVTLPVVGITAGTGISTSSTSGNFTITNTAPNVTTNLSFNGEASPVILNSSDGTDVTFVAGTNVTLNQTANVLTINSAAMANPMTTLGDIIYGGASGAPTRLAGNTVAQRKFLTQTGTGSASAAPEWYYFDETAFVYSLGRLGGQLVYGGTAAGDYLALEGTSNASTGPVLLNYYGGDIRLGSGGGAPNLLKFYETNTNGNDSNFVAFKAPSVLSANTTYTLPTADGTSNQVLTTNGSGTLSWTTPSTGISGTSSFIPYFNTSSTLGTTGLKWDNTNSYLGINNFSPGATLAVAGGSDAANTFSLYVTNQTGDKYVNFDNSGKVGINVAYPKTTLSVNGSVSRKAAVRTGIVTSYTVLDTDSWIICTNTSSTVTLTLPSAADFQGREIMVRNAAAIAVNSASSNVISLTSNPGNNPPTTTTSILPATAGKWATLVSSQAADSSWYWIIMQAN
jgi:hypothetical protein